MDIKIDGVGIDVALSDKNKQHFEEKKRIGKAAAGLVEDGDTIIPDSGSTTIEIARNLGNEHNLMVIINVLNVASQMADHQQANVNMPGGFLRKNLLSLVRGAAEENFKNYFGDKLFLAAEDTPYGRSRWCLVQL
ncbi:hypothetical protein ACFOTA_20880 [Chitinophaga sp. GCM10012297]|uniref:DeoR-like transcriptional repressor C-terminal sensor domain-containing protein n=1 Tax=Chitinophaga chungangae TaxID=2821488 RepID=A0ABS3YJ12_9BACT|nr:hypothetical protein [Chitinophaga chungangae]MBO9154681.1 hypothetical protein [Chitinophaga chungangae]